MRRLGEIDWDFPTQSSESPFSALHWHPCRFPSQIPAVSISRLTGSTERVLDPFMGSGTTLIEAQRLGRSSVGVDINPVACMMVRSKTLPIAAEALSQFADRARLRLIAEWDRIPLGELPYQVQSEKWYTPSTIRDLRKIWHLINLDEYKSELLYGVFSAILLPSCRETRHWGYICDNTNPKTQKEVDVRDLFLNTLSKYIKAYAERDRSLSGKIASAEIIQGDSASALSNLPDNYCSAMVTSPPYYGVADYVKAQRLSMEWFSLPIEPFRRGEIGARSKRHRRNSAESYLEELALVFEQAYRVLKSGAVGIVVFGQSPSRENLEPDFVQRICAAGFTVELERKRQIPSGRRMRPSLHNETVLVVRK